MNINFSDQFSVDTRSAIKRIVERYSRQIKNQPTTLDFGIDAKLPEEAFAVSGDAAIEIVGGSPRAAIYGLGKWLRQGDFRGQDAPQKPERGIYFATHFGNFYDHALPQEIADYLADLALWGCNMVSVWLDMHHYSGVDDPRAAAKIAQLKNIFCSAKVLGLRTNLLSLGNEAFADSPVELRADYHGGKNNYRSDLSGHYHVEICPSAPGGLELILAQREALWRAFADAPVDAVTICPYDQGGCTCADCAPYGANGLWKIIPGHIALSKKYFPNCEVELSTWRFDSFTDGEWAALFARRDLKQMIDRLYIDPADLPEIADGVPGDLPVVCMSEISMEGMLPWGGFGADPQIHKLDAELAKSGNIAGFRPYSEGIYEDLNKILILAWSWRARPLLDIVAEYADFYFGSGNGEIVAPAAALLADDLDHAARFAQGEVRCSPYSLEKLDPHLPYEQNYVTGKLSPARANTAWELLQQVALPPFAEAEENQLADPGAWRWRLLALRATIDVKLSRGEAVEAELAELYDLYRATDHTMPCLIPPGREIMRRIITAGVDQHI